MGFSDSAIDWYLKNKRELPWRETNDPYRIWISEIILQQTRVAQGLDYYHDFTAHFPDVQSLAEADEEEVLKCWQGLGYYSRARNLHTAAKIVVEEYGGVFPKTYEEVRSLKGVGDYTAAAICSFAYGLPYAAVDGNFYRVLARIFEVTTPIDSTKGKTEFAALAQSLIDNQRPALFNQAVMDLGATICTPSAPMCDECPMSGICLAKAHKTTSGLPTKSKKTNVRNRHFYYFLLSDGETTYLHKREQNDIWKGLYELPLIETSEAKEIDEVLSSNEANDFKSAFHIGEITKTHSAVTHVLSHQRIIATLVEATASLRAGNGRNFKRISRSELGDFPVARLTEILLSSV